jgi:hypothetical protein
MNVPNSPLPFNFRRPFLVHRSKNRKNIIFRNLQEPQISIHQSQMVPLQGRSGAYRSMFNDNNWLLELPFLTVKLLRKLTGILEVPGILRGDVGTSRLEALTLEVDV